MTKFHKEHQLKTQIAKDNGVLVEQIERDTQMDLYYIIQANGDRTMATIQPGLKA